MASSIVIFSLIIGLFMAMGTYVPQVEARAFFVFGDSLVDNGNNNYLATTARADAPPYGIDSPTHRPSGRFSNGLNIPDFISWVALGYYDLLVFFFFFARNYFNVVCNVVFCATFVRLTGACIYRSSNWLRAHIALFESTAHWRKATCWCQFCFCWDWNPQ